MKTCSAARVSVNGFMIRDVAKQKKSPKEIEMGRAGRAFLVTARRRSVKLRPCKYLIMMMYWKVSVILLTIKMATKQAIVVFQSP